MENKPNLTISNHIQSRLASPDSCGNGFEELGILYLLRVLCNPVPLSSIFTFHSPPQWADEEAQIVGYLDGAPVAMDLLGEAPQNPGLGVMHYAPKIEDVINWIENPTTTLAVLVSNNTFGPDLMIQGSGVLLMGQLKSYTKGNKECLDHFPAIRPLVQAVGMSFGFMFVMLSSF